MRDDPKVRAAKNEVRQQERAIWTDVEKLGRDLRAADGHKAAATQVEGDTARNKPKQGLGV